MTANEKKQLMAAACKVRMGVIKGTHAAKAATRRSPVAPAIPAGACPPQICLPICTARN